MSQQGIIPARAGFTGQVLTHSSIHSGSSPLARGLQPHHGAQGGRRGIIPARAGFTRTSVGEIIPLRDHPRSRGVYTSPPPVSQMKSGSSPLARGLHGWKIAARQKVRIIPARAGFTLYHGLSAQARQDHPRSRGVYGLHRGRGALGAGSFPLARGLLRRPAGADDRAGIIPARAGFTYSRFPGHPAFADHPRSRGVYRPMYQVHSGVLGSSPLARGLRPRFRRRRHHRRIIPARAGFTSPCATGRGRRGDHPRSRGVYPRPSKRERPRTGSSPLARGLRRRAARMVAAGGIIPARAGFTVATARSSRPRADHPRSRGVYVPGSPLGPGSPGSSPLARGLPMTPSFGNYFTRIIPARAGFT